MAKPNELIQVIKWESSATGGDPADEQPFPEGLNADEDVVAAAGFSPQVSGVRSATKLIWPDGNDMMFTDETVGADVSLEVLVGLGFVPVEVYTDEDATDTTTNTAFVQALRLATPPSLPAGTYLISWSFEVKNTSLNGITRTRVQLDDAENLAFSDCPITTNTTVEELVAGHVRRTLTAGVHNIDIDFFPLTGTAGQVRRKRINVRRVG